MAASGKAMKAGRHQCPHPCRTGVWAAGQQHAEAEYALGDAHYEGQCGLAEDEKKALAFFRKAAAQGYPQGFNEAQFVLGYMHYHGKGGLAEIPPNALEWFRKAAAQGHHRARLMLARTSGIVADDGPSERSKSGHRSDRSSCDHTDSCRRCCSARSRNVRASASSGFSCSARE